MEDIIPHHPYYKSISSFQPSQYNETKTTLSIIKSNNNKSLSNIWKMNKGNLNTWHILCRCATVCFPENTLSMSEHNDAYSIRLISHVRFDSSALVLAVSFQICDWWPSICFPSEGIWGLHVLPSDSQNEWGPAQGVWLCSSGPKGE